MAEMDPDTVGAVATYPWAGFNPMPASLSRRFPGPAVLSIEFVRGEGPLIHNPIRTAADIDRLHAANPEESLSFTLDAIRLARAELDSRAIPLIGFSGAPFTLACYAVEGGASKHHARVKQLMMGDSPAWHALMRWEWPASGT